MSALRIEDHVRCRMVTPDGPLSITGEIIKIKAKKRVRLTPSKALKDAVL